MSVNTLGHNPLSSPLLPVSGFFVLAQLAVHNVPTTASSVGTRGKEKRRSILPKLSDRLTNVKTVRGMCLLTAACAAH